MNHNRIVSIFLIFSVFFMSFTFLCVPKTMAAVAENSADRYENRLGLLTALGVVSDIGAAEEDMSEDTFLRAVFSLMAYDGYFKAQDGSAKDFAKSHGLYGNDVINGISSAEDAYVVLLNALGYDVIAASYGKYKNGYLSIAMKEGLSDNVKKADSLTNGNGVTILYNALFMNFCDSVGNNRFGKIKGTVLENTFECYEAEGVVTGVYLQSISGGSPKFKDEIIIDNITYKTQMDDFYSVFGKRVKFYYNQNDGENNLVYAWCDRDSYITIDASMVTQISRTGQTYEIKYEDLRGRQYKKSVIPQYISLNGEIIDYKNTNITELLDFYTGNITLTDTNKDGEFDCILLEKYENYLVSTATDKALYDANGKEPIYLNDKEDDKDLEYWYDVYINGKKGTLSSVKENDVVSVYKNKNGNIIKIVATSGKVLNGTVDSVVKDERGVKIIIDGLPYYSPEGNKIPESGSTGVFYMDSQSVIAGFEVKDIYMFGYFIAAGTKSMNRMQMKICPLGVKGAKIFNCSRNIYIKEGSNKRKKCSAEQAIDIFNSNPIYKPGLIKYRTDANGNIISVCLPNDMSKTPLNANPSEFNYMGQSAKDVTVSNSKLGRYAVDIEKTVVFSVPIGDNVTDELYSGQVKLKDGTNYTKPMFYNTDNFLTAGAVVIFEKTFSDGLIFPTTEMNMDNTPFSVIKKIKLIGDNSNAGISVEFTFVGEKGEFKGYAPYSKDGIVYAENMLQRAEGFPGSGMADIVKYPTAYILDTTKLFDNGYDKLNVGDMVQVRINGDNRIECMKRLWSNVRNQLMASDPRDGISYIDGHMVSAPNWEFGNNQWYVFGEMINRNKSIMVIDATSNECNGLYSHENTTHELFQSSESQLSYGGLTVFALPKVSDSIYVLDRANSNDVYKGEIDDIRAGNELVFAINYGKFRGVLVIK